AGPSRRASCAGVSAAPRRPRARRRPAAFLRWARARAGSELRWLVACAAAVAAALVFAALASAGGEGSTRTFDEAVLQALRSPADPGLPRGPAWLGNAARDVTALGSWPVLLLLALAVLGYLALERAWGAAVLVLASLAGAGLWSQLLKDLFE